MQNFVYHAGQCCAMLFPTTVLMPFSDHEPFGWLPFRNEYVFGDNFSDIKIPIFLCARCVCIQKRARLKERPRFTCDQESHIVAHKLSLLYRAVPAARDPHIPRRGGVRPSHRHRHRQRPSRWCLRSQTATLCAGSAAFCGCSQRPSTLLQKRPTSPEDMQDSRGDNCDITAVLRTPPIQVDFNCCKNLIFPKKNANTEFFMKRGWVLMVSKKGVDPAAPQTLVCSCARFCPCASSFLSPPFRISKGMVHSLLSNSHIPSQQMVQSPRSSIKPQSPA